MCTYTNLNISFFIICLELEEIYLYFIKYLSFFFLNSIKSIHYSSLIITKYNKSKLLNINLSTIFIFPGFILRYYVNV